MERQIVVYRYKEDTAWLENLEENVIIYNKGPKLHTKHKVVNLPNIGMVLASQLFHCIENYNNLADKTLFIQANPWDGEFELKNNFKNTPFDSKRLINFYFDFLKGEEISNNYRWELIGNKYNLPMNYNQRHHDCFITYTFDWDEYIKKYIDLNSSIDWYKPVRMYRNGHIALSKSAILSNKKEYYIKLMEFCKYDVPVIEWNAESTLNFIFNVDNSGKIIDLGHDKVDFETLEDYRVWHSPIDID